MLYNTKIWYRFFEKETQKGIIKRLKLFQKLLLL